MANPFDLPRLRLAMIIRLRERLLPLQEAWWGWLTRRGPHFVLAGRWPWPWRQPYRRRRLVLSAPGGGIGDELMCTAVFDEIKRRNPECHITFVCRFTDYFSTHPSVDAVLPITPVSRAQALRLAYHYVLPPERPLVTLAAECVGLRSDCPVATLPPHPVESAVSARLQDFTRPCLVVQPLSSGWTTNKSWPLTYWQQLIEMLLPHWTVLEVGTVPAFPAGTFSANFHTFAGQTGFPELAAIIAHGALFIGPSSAGMHFAHATGTPSLIIFGGYERAAGYRFPKMHALESRIACSPCWRQTCPFGLACLHEITPAQVFAQVRALLPPPTARTIS